MRDMFIEILPDCLDAGVSEWDFWEMTLGEILNAINSFNRRFTRDQKEKAALAYRLADLVAAGVAASFSKDAKFPSIFDAFPGVFEAERKRVQQEEETRQMQLYKARLNQFAENHNRKWGGRTNDT